MNFVTQFIVSPSCVQEVAHHRRGILQRFLTDLIEEQANGSVEDDQPPEPSHGAVIILLREILRQFLVRNNHFLIVKKFPPFFLVTF